MPETIVCLLSSPSTPDDSLEAHDNTLINCIQNRAHTSETLEKALKAHVRGPHRKSSRFLSPRKAAEHDAALVALEGLMAESGETDATCLVRA